MIISLELLMMAILMIIMTTSTHNNVLFGRDCAQHLSITLFSYQDNSVSQVPLLFLFYKKAGEHKLINEQQ